MKIDEYSIMSLFLEMYVDAGASPIAIGTGFSIKVNEQNYLITNWHVVTGRDHQTNKPLSSICDPDILKIWFFTKDIGRWLRRSIRLRDENGNKLWIEHPQGRNVDVVAIPYTPSADIFVKDLDLSTQNVKLKIYPSKSVSIIGYPNGLTSGGKFPIWKNGHIASEMDINYNGQPVFLIDATTRTGMSGSPVILRDSGLCQMENDAMQGGTYTRFLGVYSGRIDGGSEIGRVWKPSVIDEIIQTVGSTGLLPRQSVLL